MTATTAVRIGRVFGATLLALACAACSAPLERPETAPGDCVLDASGGIAEAAGGLDAVFAGAGQGRAGYLAARNAAECQPYVKAFSATPNGTIACVGSDEWCTAAMEARPVTMPNARWVELLRAIGREPPTDEPAP